MKWPILTLAVLSLVAGGCGRSPQSRQRAFESGEQQCIRQYRSGDLPTARQALLDYRRLLEQEQASGLALGKISWLKAVTAARLTLVCRQLGEAGPANRHLHEAVVWARKDAQESGNQTRLDQTDEEIGSFLLEVVTQFDRNEPPKWRLKSAPERIGGT